MERERPNGQARQGAISLALTHSHMRPHSRALKLESGDVELRAGDNSARIWVDANRPEIRVEIQTQAPVELKATSEVWRTKEKSFDKRVIGKTDLGFWEWDSKPDGLTFDPDAILPAKDNRVSWCHFNKRSLYPLVFEREHLESLLTKYPDPLLHRCFGVTMKGEGLVSSSDLTLKSLNRVALAGVGPLRAHAAGRYSGGLA